VNNNVNDGFRDAQLSSQISGIQNAVTSGFGDVQLGIAGVNQNICQTGNATVAAITGAQNAVSQQLYNNEIASLNRSFAEQTANTAGFTATNNGIADLKYTIASEACADRAAVTAGIQTVLDKLCALELDGYKRENDQLRSENSNLRNQGFIANEINQQNEVFYNRLKNCPVNAVPVAGNTPLFSCNPSFNSPNYGCGCGNGF
jgi:hypothetical protein